MNQLAVHLDVEKAHVRDEKPEALGLLPVVRAHDEAADLGRPVVRVADLENDVPEVLVERRRVALLLEDVDVDVRRVASAELPDDHRRADDAVLLEIDEDEDVLAPARVLDGAGEALLRVLEDAADLLAVVRQVHRVEMPRDVEELVLVGRHRAADFVGPRHEPA